MNIYDILPEGQENAVSRRQLMAMTGLSDRRLRRHIAAERRAGLLILSSTEKGGGYFRHTPGNAEELRRFIISMVNRGAETFAALRAAREALAEINARDEGGVEDGGE